MFYFNPSPSSKKKNDKKRGALNLDPEDFEEAFGFEKPKMTDTVVLTCKAGIRSQQAAQFAAMAAN